MRPSWHVLPVSSMQTMTFSSRSPRERWRRGMRVGPEYWATPLRTCLWALVGWMAFGAPGADAPGAGPSLAPDIVYHNDRKPAGPWSIHVVRVPRGRSPFQIHAVHAEGRAVGLSRLSEQTAMLDFA